jgi:hypothetical protein
MSIPQTDAIIISAIRIGLADIRRNEFLVNDIMSQFVTDPYLKDSWGKQQIDAFKAFLQNTKINIVMETRLPDTSKLPAIVVKIGGGQEDQQKEGLGDSPHYNNIRPASTEGIFPDKLITVGPVTPISFDSDSGMITFDPSVDLSDVFEGQYVFDEVNKKAYTIQFVMDSSNIMIDSGLRPNLQNMTIRPQSNSVRNTNKSIWFWENYTFTCISTEPNELMFLYSLMMYISIRYKKSLFEARGFEVSTLSYSEVYAPNPSDDTNILFGRDIMIRGRVEHAAIEATHELITGINTKILIDPTNDGGIDTPQDPTITPAGILPQVEKQQWQMIGDEVPVKKGRKNGKTGK